MVESAREMCGSVRVGWNNPKSMWWSNEVKAAVIRKNAPGKEMFGTINENAKERRTMLKEDQKEIKKVGNGRWKKE